MVAEVAETILPKTKTPGAKEMAVPQFIDKMVKDTMDEGAQKDLLESLGEFEDEVDKKFGKSFWN